MSGFEVFRVWGGGFGRGFPVEGMRAWSSGVVRD